MDVAGFRQHKAFHTVLRACGVDLASPDTACKLNRRECRQPKEIVTCIGAEWLSFRTVVQLWSVDSFESELNRLIF
ncbi:MAG: hypothetical protein JWM87_825 [Candidatus Eremiobacteraeota bacterium]|nr:hypothetical protein [Candidatus Eremiobacteraeota bacterium]